MGYKPKAANKPNRDAVDGPKPGGQKNSLPVKNMDGDKGKADGTPYNAEVHATSLFNIPDGEYAKAALDKRLAGYAESQAHVIADVNGPDPSDGPTTAQAYPTKMNLSKFGFKGGRN